MKLNSKGQVTIPAELRHRHGLAEGDQVDVVEDGNTLRIVHHSEAESRGERVVSRMRTPQGRPEESGSSAGCETPPRQPCPQTS